MNVLITGFTGFIGSHLYNQLLKEKNIFLVGMTRNKSMLKELKENSEIRFGDLSDPDSLKNVTKDIDVVIHLAGLMRFHEAYKNLYKYNVQGTRFLALDAMRNNVKHFIYVSSTEAIGPVDSIPADEKAPYNPTYGYGKSKQVSEEWLNKQYIETGFPITIVRPTGVYGPGDLYVGLSTVRAVANKKVKILPGKGNHFVHFTYVDDVVNGLICVMKNPEKIVGETFHITSDDYHTYKEIFTIIAELLGLPPPNRSVPYSLAKIYLGFQGWKNKQNGIDDFIMHASLVDDMKTDRAYSNQKAKTMLGFKPQFSYKEGISNTINWYKKNKFI
jgi:dihydroflavonol-4-reductase